MISFIWINHFNLRIVNWWNWQIYLVSQSFKRIIKYWLMSTSPLTANLNLHMWDVKRNSSNLSDSLVKGLLICLFKKRPRQLTLKQNKNRFLTSNTYNLIDKWLSYKFWIFRYAWLVKEKIFKYTFKYTTFELKKRHLRHA